MIPKWFCPGIVFLVALVAIGPASWMMDKSLFWICGGTIVVFGILTGFLCYQEWKEDKQRKWEKGKP